MSARSPSWRKPSTSFELVCVLTTLTLFQLCISILLTDDFVVGMLIPGRGRVQSQDLDNYMDDSRQYWFELLPGRYLDDRVIIKEPLAGLPA